MNVIFTDSDPQQIIEKIINNKYVQKAIGFVKNNKTAVKIASIAASTLIVVAITASVTGVTFGFDVKYSGRILGTVGSRSVCNDARSIAVENVSSDKAESAVCSPKLALTLTVSNKLDDAAKVADAIIESSDSVVKGSALVINGKTVACVQVSGLDKLLNARLMSYYIEGAENQAQFVDDVTYETGFYISDELNTIEELETIVNALPVKTVSKINTDVSIPYSTTKVKTDTKPMGYYQITTEGKKGVSRKSIVVESINGEETSRTQTAEQVISEPVNRVITIGTASVKTSSKSGASSGGFICPIEKGKFKISSYYGDGRNHKAMDFAANRGVAFFASASGQVTYAGYDSDFGYNIIIDHGNGIKTRYAHASYLSVSKGQVVSQGDMIGAVGNTGYSTGNHLHFEVIVNGTRVNPAPYIGY